MRRVIALLLLYFKTRGTDQTTSVEIISDWMDRQQESLVGRGVGDLSKELVGSEARRVFANSETFSCELAEQCSFIRGRLCDAQACLYPEWAAKHDGETSETGISEEELQSLPVAENPRLEVRLESDNTIMRYIGYGKSTSDAYPEYHYGTALSLLSIATRRNLVLRLAQGDVYPNIWAFMLGRSTISRKTAAILKALRFADDLFPYTSLPQSYSPEGLIEELSENPRGYLFKDEAGGMLAAMSKNYMLEMRDLYCTLYDCPESYRRKLRSSQRKARTQFEIQNAFVNIVTATTPETFREHTTLLDLTSGWLLRFLYFHPNYKKDWMAFKQVEEEDFALYGEVLGRISQVKGMFWDRADPLEITLEPAAWAYYQTWQEQRETALQESADAIELALWGRLALYGLKLAMLFTIARADYHEGTQVNLEHIQESCRQIDAYFLPVGRLVAEEVAREETTNLQNKILGSLSRAGGKLKRRDLLRKLHVKIRDVDEALAALQESEEIDLVISTSKGGENVWVLLRQLNRKEANCVKPKTEAGDDLSQLSHLSTCLICRTNLDECTCIHGTGATLATPGTDATPSTPSMSGMAPFKACSSCGTSLEGQNHVEQAGRTYCYLCRRKAHPGPGLPTTRSPKPVRLLPEVPGEAALWSAVVGVLHKYPCGHHGRRGVLVADVVDRCDFLTGEVEAALQGASWEKEVLEPSGLAIWWAPTETKSPGAIGVEVPA